MGADACHISVIQHNDLICIQDSADSLCYDNRGNILCLFLQGLAKLAVSLEIKCGKAVVKDQDFRLFGNRSCNGKTLLLATGYIISSLGNRCFVAFRLRFNKVI